MYIVCVVCAIVTSFCGIFLYGIWINGYFKRKGIKYAKPKFPFIGNVLECLLMKEHYFIFMHRVYNAFPDSGYVGFFHFTKPNIILRDLNLIKEIGIKEYENFPNHRMYIDENTDSLFGNFLVTLRGEKWKAMRAALTPAFSRYNLKNMFEYITICSEQFSQYFENEINTKIFGEEYIDVDISDYLEKYTNDVISLTALGLKNNSFENPNNEMLRYARKVANLNRNQLIKFVLYTIFPKTMKFFGVSIYDTKTINFYNETAQNLINYRIKNNFPKREIIQFLIEAKKKTELENKTAFSDDEITAQLVFFYVAGFKSTSLVSSSFIYELALQPDLQKRLQNEIDTVIQSNERLTFEIIESMKYLDMIVSEVLRMWPPTACDDRECVNDYSLFCDSDKDAKSYNLKPKDIVWIPIYSIQRDAKYFPDPDKFDPERFAPENRDSFNPLAYMPFGIGPRKCIGIRYGLIVVKVVIFYLFSRFDFVATEKTRMPLIIDPNIILFQSKHGYCVGAKKREKIVQWLKSD